MQFTVRIEMHNATSESYAYLHNAMDAEEFSRILTGMIDGRKYHMPTGEYWTEAFTTLEEVLEAATRAVRVVDPDASITASGDGRILFWNCAPVVEESGWYRATLYDRLFNVPLSTHSQIPVGRRNDLDRAILDALETGFRESFQT